MKLLSSLVAVTMIALMAGCNGGGAPVDRPNNPNATAEKTDPEENALNNKGIGPVTSVNLGEIDPALVEEGKTYFEAKCTACHKIDKKYIGPALSGVTERRTPEWVMNMILNPTEMIAKDELAKKLVAENNGAIMADQSLSEEEARAILEYFRTL